MGLSNDLVSQFAKIIKPESNDNKESTLYGTFVIHNGKKYVRLDGSELLTPVEQTATAKQDDRVSVTIKNHTATVTGNYSSPAARSGDVNEISDKIGEYDTLIADKASIKDLKATNATVETLVADNVVIKKDLKAANASIESITADNVKINKTLTANNAAIENLQTTKISSEVADLKYATIESLNATNGKFNDLSSDYAKFKVATVEDLSAKNATIQKLETEKLSATDADLKYANIDFSNIGTAAIEQFYATSGIIKDLVIGDQTVTGELVGVTIKGDLIEGGTVVADKLVVKGQNGLYYKLNTDGVTTEKEQTDYNSLNGSVITAKSIAATKISVEDLVAFDATIGGFNITDKAIYSGVKSSISNTTRGIYQDKDGQLAVGDGSNYLKYFKDSDGKYKLEISAASLKFSASDKDLETVLGDTITKTEIISEINQSPEKVSIKASKISLEGLVTANENFKVLEDGSIQAVNGKFTGIIEGSSGSFTKGFFVNVPCGFFVDGQKKYPKSWQLSISDSYTYLGWYSEAGEEEPSYVSHGSHITFYEGKLWMTGGSEVKISSDYGAVKVHGFDGFRVVNGSDAAVFTVDNNGNVGVNGGITTYNGRMCAGGKVTIWTDSEGGNISILSPNNREYQFDAATEDLRLYTYKNGTYSSITLLNENGASGFNNLYCTTLTSRSNVKCSGALYVYGGLELFLGSTPYIDFHFQNSSKDYTSRLIEEVSGSLFLRIPGGSGWFHAAGYAVDSSKHVKSNIKDIQDEEALKLLQLRPVSFDYKWGQDNKRGMIAEEVMNVYPELVQVPEGYDEDIFEYKEEGSNIVPSLDYASFVPYLIKMIQIQQKEINELKEEIKHENI